MAVRGDDSESPWHVSDIQVWGTIKGVAKKIDSMHYNLFAVFFFFFFFWFGSTIFIDD